MVGAISKFGIPSIIASDVSPAPSFVLKVAARFNVSTFTPARTILEQEKKQVAGSMENAHERDALCAAIKCHREYANRLRQIDGMQTSLNKDSLKHLLIQGHRLSNAIIILEKKAATKDAILPDGQNSAGGGSGKPIAQAINSKSRLENDIAVLANENVNLRKALDAERKEVAVLEAELENVKSSRYAERWRDTELRKLAVENKRLSWMVGKLKKRK